MALGSWNECQCRRKEPLPPFGADFREVCATGILVQHRFKPRLQPRLSLRQRNVLLQPTEDLHPARATIEHRVEAGNGLGRHGGWNPKGWNLAHVDTTKRWRSNADNRHWVPVDQHLAAHDILRASELVFPEVVGEHNHGTRTGY